MYKHKIKVIYEEEVKTKEIKNCTATNKYTKEAKPNCYNN